MREKLSPSSRGVTAAKAALLVLAALLLPVPSHMDQRELPPAPDQFTWSTAPDLLPQPLDSMASAIVGNWLFLLGGRDAQGAPSAAVYRASLSASGQPGPWQHLPDRSLPRPLYSHCAVVGNDRIYLVGGYSGVYEAGSYMATVDPISGAVGPWQPATTLPAGQARATHAVVIAHDQLYVLGGFRITDVLDTVYRAAILPNGELGAWQPDRSLPASLFRLGAVAYDGNLYVVGGRPTTSSISRKIYRSAIQPDGSLGPWSEAGLDLLPAGRADHASLVVRDELYVIGGTDGTDSQATVDRFRLGSSLTPLPPGASLPHPRHRMAAVVSGSRVANVLGGLQDSVQQRTVYYAQLAGFDRSRYLPRLEHDFTVPVPAPAIAAARSPRSIRVATPTTASPMADLQVEKSTQSSSVYRGEQLVAQVRVRNTGQAHAVSVGVDDSLPDNVGYVSSNLPTCNLPTCNP